jgi:ABC-type cobalamin transport system ATPase subunit
MAHRISIDRIGAAGPLTLEIGDGDRVFVVGPNGAGKSSLVNVLASNFNRFARVNWAHRQNVLADSTLNLTPSQRQHLARDLQSWDMTTQARVRDGFSDSRPRAALYDLINASDTLSRDIARAWRSHDDDALRLLGSRLDPIERLNGILKAAALPIVLQVSDARQLQARKGASAWFPAGELSDGERSAILLAADILGAPSQTVLLLDEPERHLHRSISAPLLRELFDSRPDCAFVITTHDLSLILQHAGSRVLLLRDCQIHRSGGVSWDLDILETNAPIDDDLKRIILGARSVLLFVEGDASSLDMALYRILFPTVTVAARGGCQEVMATVRSLRGIGTLHWLDAFGIVDRDGRDEEEIATLRDQGIHVLPVCTVESLYYHPEAIRLVARQQATNFGCESETLAAEAEARALDALKACRKSLIEARCRWAMEQDVLASLWQGEGPWHSSAINLPINPAAMLAAEGTVFDDLIANKDLVGLVARYGIKRTGFAAAVARALRFREVGDYPEALRARLKADAAARETLIRLFGDLPQLLAEATDPVRRSQRASASPPAAAPG